MCCSSCLNEAYSHSLTSIFTAVLARIFEKVVTWYDNEVSPSGTSWVAGLYRFFLNLFLFVQAGPDHHPDVHRCHLLHVCAAVLRAHRDHDAPHPGQVPRTRTHGQLWAQIRNRTPHLWVHYLHACDRVCQCVSKAFFLVKNAPSQGKNVPLAILLPALPDFLTVWYQSLKKW